MPLSLAVSIRVSSREIAELCVKQHQHVRRDITQMLAELGEDASNFGRIYLDQSNRQQEEFNLPKDLTLTLVSGYNVQLRKRIIDRWMELEAERVHLAQRRSGTEPRQDQSEAWHALARGLSNDEPGSRNGRGFWGRENSSHDTR
jgi:phage regulator Rha-like protein